MDKTQIQMDDGFTLVEVMIALLVFTAGILSVATMQISALHGNSVANQLTTASAFGCDLIEQMMSWDYDDNRFKESNDNQYILPDGSNWTADGHEVDSNKRFHAYWEVSDDDPVADSKKIEVTVYWVRNKVLKKFTLTTVKAQ